MHLRFFEPVTNNASSSSPFNAGIVGHLDVLTFSLTTVLAFHKDASSILISALHACIFCVEAKKWSQWQNLSWKSTSH